MCSVGLAVTGVGYWRLNLVGTAIATPALHLERHHTAAVSSYTAALGLSHDALTHSADDIPLGVSAKEIP
jgi:hypothetical protein